MPIRRARFIPAHAGNTRSGAVYGGRAAVHPRARGEHAPGFTPQPRPDGSSPRTRGTHSRIIVKSLHARFIPAHAGNTMGAVYRAQKRTVHPRARGEHFEIIETDQPRTGSSPRTRGTRTTTATIPFNSRFIPAHAGNTAPSHIIHICPSVHPRARGEHIQGAQIGQTLSGSSPRTRGTPGKRWTRSTVWRFIPAHAGNTGSGKGSGRKKSVHPRARGEHMALNGKKFKSGGSSPRTRGTPHSFRRLCPRRRFIPAHAGNTAFRPRLKGRWAVHPRARGEHVSGFYAHGKNVGSSPRTRGTQQIEDAGAAIRRFIPAHAGNTYFSRCSGVSLSVHPRARGEHGLPVGQVLRALGSSPRTRGTRAPVATARPKARFIPAHAGNTTGRAIGASGAPVHPRARGEHRHAGCWFAVGDGSSPRTRGTLAWWFLGSRFQRFIPAHAGNTPSSPLSCGSAPVHPRARGEHSSSTEHLISLCGSSPRTRGTRQTQGRSAQVERFIPAHAGNTPYICRPARSCSVHPRARGEHCGRGAFGKRPCGSSPRTRGTLSIRHGCPCPLRFIPAHAGNTFCSH